MNGGAVNVSQVATHWQQLCWEEQVLVREVVLVPIKLFSCLMPDWTPSLLFGADNMSSNMGLVLQPGSAPSLDTR